ncbi:YhjD/YihY/BrkB family envelope integrity protein [Nocardioides sp.]|uniref:YihY/virulence factor BrkB family protein n=1 Tax=Nocardioides sp. TaxID=35761 RepID=UPI0039E5D1FF
MGKEYQSDPIIHVDLDSFFASVEQRDDAEDGDAPRSTATSRIALRPVGVVSALDRGQRRFPPAGFPLAVVYKFFDDQGNYLAAIMTYYAFVAIFPLMLLGSSILGFFLEGREELQEQLLDSALSQFPIIGEQLAQEGGLRGSTGGVVIGSLVALYGAMGLGQAIQNTLNTAWSVPRNSRPNPFLLRFRSLVLLATAGVAVLAVSIVSTLGANTQVFGHGIHDGLRWVIVAVTVLIVGAMFTVLLRFGTTRDHPLRSAAPGAFVLAVLWQVLQYGGAVYVTRVINGADSLMNQTFATVLGLIAFIYLAAVMGVLSMEVNVVLARHLWPRALLTPFTDAVDLTDADRRAYASYALMNRHKGFQTVAVTFDGRDGDTHEIVMDPSWARKTKRPRKQVPPEPPNPHEPPSQEYDGRF